MYRNHCRDPLTGRWICNEPPPRVHTNRLDKISNFVRKRSLPLRHFSAPSKVETEETPFSKVKKLLRRRPGEERIKVEKPPVLGKRITPLEQAYQDRLKQLKRENSLLAEHLKLTDQNTPQGQALVNEKRRVVAELKYHRDAPKRHEEAMRRIANLDKGSAADNSQNAEYE